MRKDHRVDETEALPEPCRDWIRESRQHIRPEEKRACGRKRQIEASEQPKGQKRLHRKSARKRVQAEQCCQLVDGSSGGSQCCRLRSRLLRLLFRHVRIKCRAKHPERRI